MAIPTADVTRMLKDGITVVPYFMPLRANIIYTAEVVSGHNRGDTEISVENGVDINYSYMDVGLTIYAGTGPGLSDKGKARIRSFSGFATAPTFIISENSIDWSTVTDIYVVLFYDIWAIKPYIDSDGNFYKDRDLAYSDSLVNKPVVIEENGGHQVKFVDETDEAVFDVDLSSSYAMEPGATMASFSASVVPPTGVTVNVNGGTGIGDITVTAPGQYWVKYTGTDSVGKSRTTKFMLIAADPQVGNTYYPYTDVAFTEVVGNLDTGVWKSTIEIGEDINPNDFIPQGLCFLWKETNYAGEKTSIGPSGNRLLIGYSSVENWERGKDGKSIVTFDVATINEKLSELPMYSISIEYRTNPNKWWQADDLTSSRAIFHLFSEHSTLLEVCNFKGLNASTREIKAVDDFVEGTIFDQAKNFANNYSEHGIIACSKEGTLYYEINTQYLNDTARDALEVLYTIEPNVLIDKLTIVRKPFPTANYCNLSGFLYNGATNVATPYIAEAPGEVPYDIGRQRLRFERQVLSSQADANERVGRALAVVNNIYPRVSLTLKGDWSSWLDIVPQNRWWRLTFEEDFFNRGIAFTNTRLLLQNISITHDQGSLSGKLDFIAEAFGEDGVAVPIPVIDTTAPNIEVDNEIPPIDTIAVPTLVSATINATGTFVLKADDDDWTERNDLISGVFKHALDVVALGDEMDEEDSIMFRVGYDGSIYKTTTLGRSWLPVTIPLHPDDSEADKSTIWYHRIFWNTSTSEMYVLATQTNGGATRRDRYLFSDDDGDTFSWVTEEANWDNSRRAFPIFGCFIGSTFYVTRWTDGTGDTPESGDSTLQGWIVQTTGTYPEDINLGNGLELFSMVAGALQGTKYFLGEASYYDAINRIRTAIPIADPVDSNYLAIIGRIVNSDGVVVLYETFDALTSLAPTVAGEYTDLEAYTNMHLDNDGMDVYYRGTAVGK